MLALNLSRRSHSLFDLNVRQRGATGVYDSRQVRRGDVSGKRQPQRIEKDFAACHGCLALAW
jgi:hypothetical protein